MKCRNKIAYSKYNDFENKIIYIYIDLAALKLQNLGKNWQQKAEMMMALKKANEN